MVAACVCSQRRQATIIMDSRPKRQNEAKNSPLQKKKNRIPKNIFKKERKEKATSHRKVLLSAIMASRNRLGNRQEPLKPQKLQKPHKLLAIPLLSGLF